MTLPDDRSPLDEITERARYDHINARNMLMLEAVISAMLDIDGMATVADKLREAADQLEDYG